MTKRLNSKYKICKQKKGLYKNIFGVEKSTKFRSVRILKRNSFSAKQKFNKLSFFNKSLQIKQSLKHFYSNISEKTFQHLLIKSIKSQSKTINKLISLLESRIDSVLYRASFVTSFHMSRQLINHGFVFVNSKQIYSNQISLFQGDFIEIKDKNIFLRNKLIDILNQGKFKQYFSLIPAKNQSYPTTKFNILKKDKNFLDLLKKSLNLKNRNLTPLLKKIFFEYNQLLNIQKTKKLELVPLHLEVNYKLLKIVFLWDPCLKHTYYPIKINYKKHDQSDLFSYNEVIYID